MRDVKNSAKILTLRVHLGHLNARTFKVPLKWISRSALLAWTLLAVACIASTYAIKEYVSERSARPELVKELENEIQELKIALEKKGTTPPPATSGTHDQNIKADAMATNEKPNPAAGTAIEGKEGVWTGLAENVVAPPAGNTPPIKLEEARIDWQGKYANFAVNVLYREPGKGSQQGHIVVLARSNDLVFAHPEGVLNTGSGAFLFNPNKGEYFSVAKFRVLKTRFGPFENQKQLSEIQVFLFDLNNNLIMVQNFQYGNK